MAGNFAGLQALVSKEAPKDLGDRPEEALTKIEAPIQTAPLAIIHPSRFQKYPPLPQDVEKLRKSIASVGILEALLVRPHPEKPGELEVLAGHTRTEVGLLEHLTEVPVKVFDVPDSVAIEIVTATNLQRKVLDPVAETDAVLELLSVKLGKSRSEVLQVFYQSGNGKHNVMLTDEWKTIEEVLASTARTTPDSFRANRVPLLGLPSEILDAVRKGQLEYTKAIAISRVKDSGQQLSVLNRAIAESLTLAQIKQAIKELAGGKVREETTASRASAIAKLVKKTKLDPEVQAKVDICLEKIKQLIEG